MKKATTTTTRTTINESRKGDKTMKNTITNATTTSTTTMNNNDFEKETTTMKTTTTEVKTIEQLNAMKTASNQAILEKARQEVARKEQLVEYNNMLKNATSEKLIGNNAIGSGSNIKGISPTEIYGKQEQTNSMWYENKKPLTNERKKELDKQAKEYKKAVENRKKADAKKLKEVEKADAKAMQDIAKAKEKDREKLTENIADDNIQLMANCITLRAIKTAIMVSGGTLTADEFDAIVRKKIIEKKRKQALKSGELTKSDFDALPDLEQTKKLPSANNNRFAWELYIDAILGINRKIDSNYIVGDGYALVQDCCMFLTQFIGKKLSDEFDGSTTKNGEKVTIMRACFYFINNKIYSQKQRVYKHCYIDDYEHEHEPIAIRDKYDLNNVREVESTENIIAMLELTAKQWEVLNARLQGLSHSQIADKFGFSRPAVVKHLKLIQDKVIKIFGGSTVEHIYKYFGTDASTFDNDNE